MKYKMLKITEYTQLLYIAGGGGCVLLKHAEELRYLEITTNTGNGVRLALKC